MPESAAIDPIAAIIAKKPPARVLGPISRTDVVVYQGASGDFEPMHHDEPFAKAAGMPAPIVVGMYPAGAMCAWASDWLGPANVRKVKVRWKAPVWPGDTLTIDGQALGVDESGLLHVELSCTGAAGRVVLQGEMLFALDQDPP